MHDRDDDRFRGELPVLPLATNEGVGLIEEIIRAEAECGQWREFMEREIRMVELIQMLRLREVTQAMRPQVSQLRAVHSFANVHLHGLRDQHLTGMADLADARAAV